MLYAARHTAKIKGFVPGYWLHVYTLCMFRQFSLSLLALPFKASAKLQNRLNKSGGSQRSPPFLHNL